MYYSVLHKGGKYTLVEFNIAYDQFKQKGKAAYLYVF